jgi:succinate dehydrogenase / fumarate reductase cytochrome b subunit
MANIQQQSPLTHFVNRLHRITGVGVFLFLAIHLLHIWLMGLGAEPFDTVTGMLTHPVVRLLHIGLFFSVLFHAFNGTRLALLDFFPGLVRYQRQMLFFMLLVVALFFFPITLLILMDTFLPSL